MKHAQNALREHRMLGKMLGSGNHGLDKETHARAVKEHHAIGEMIKGSTKNPKAEPHFLGDLIGMIRKGIGI